MPRASEVLAMFFDYNIGWCWRILLDWYYRLKGTR